MSETYWQVGEDTVNVAESGDFRFINLDKGGLSVMITERRGEKPTGMVQDNTKDETSAESYKTYTNSECGLLLVSKWEKKPLEGADAAMADCMHAYATLLAHRNIPLNW